MVNPRFWGMGGFGEIGGIVAEMANRGDQGRGEQLG
jgi:hypothetical protein